MNLVVVVTCTENSAARRIGTVQVPQKSLCQPKKKARTMSKDIQGTIACVINNQEQKPRLVHTPHTKGHQEQKAERALSTRTREPGTNSQIPQHQEQEQEAQTRKRDPGFLWAHVPCVCVCVRAHTHTNTRTRTTIDT